MAAKAGFRLNFGLVQNDLKQYAGAKESLTKAVTLDPKNSDAHIALGEALVNLKEGPAAIAHFEKALAQNPKDFSSAFYLATLYSKSSHPKAISYYQKALAARPNSADAISGLGLVYFEDKNYDEAITVFKQLSEASPADPAAWQNLGAAYSMKGDNEGAARAFELALTNNSDKKIELRRWLGNYYIVKGELDKAETIYNKIVEDAPTNSEALDGLGRIADRRGKSDDAVKLYNRAITADPKNKFAYNNLGVALEKKGMVDQATANYKKALAIDPNFADARKNLERFGNK